MTTCNVLSSVGFWYRKSTLDKNIENLSKCGLLLKGMNIDSLIVTNTPVNTRCYQYGWLWSMWELSALPQ